ncbi:MAG: cell division protein ZipA [Gammaproteobacteria bacterium]|nr:cell division protein ZipA [Gammaproteobacteria bacterium]
MEYIRWILLLAGVVIVLGIYMFTRWQGRRNAPDTMDVFDADEHVGEREIDPLFDDIDDDSYIDAELHRLDRLITDDADTAADTNVAPLSGTPTEVHDPEKITTLFVLAPTGVPFRGTFLMEAMTEAGLQYGDMQIFHRIEKQAGRDDTLFSVANIVEPGTFEPNRMDSFTTQGVVLILRLPGPVDAVKAFDAMVTAARSLATSLEGSLCDATRSVLTNQTISHMREEVVDYQLRQRVAKTAS